MELHVNYGRKPKGILCTDESCVFSVKEHRAIVDDRLGIVEHWLSFHLCMCNWNHASQKPPLNLYPM